MYGLENEINRQKIKETSGTRETRIKQLVQRTTGFRSVCFGINLRTLLITVQVTAGVWGWGGGGEIF